MRIKAAHLAVTQVSVGLDGPDHCAQGIHMGADQQGMAFATQAADDRALAGHGGGKAQRRQGGGKRRMPAG